MSPHPNLISPNYIPFTARVGGSIIIWDGAGVGALGVELGWEHWMWGWGGSIGCGVGVRAGVVGLGHLGVLSLTKSAISANFGSLFFQTAPAWHVNMPRFHRWGCSNAYTLLNDDYYAADISKISCCLKFIAMTIIVVDNY